MLVAIDSILHTACCSRLSLSERDVLVPPDSRVTKGAWKRDALRAPRDNDVWEFWSLSLKSIALVVVWFTQHVKSCDKEPEVVWAKSVARCMMSAREAFSGGLTRVRSVTRRNHEQQQGVTVKIAIIS